MNQAIQFIGNLSAFIGTLIIIQYGVPNQIDTGGKVGFALLQIDENEIKKIAKYKFLSKCGLGLIAFGFALQTVGCIFPNL